MTPRSSDRDKTTQKEKRADNWPSLTVSLASLAAGLVLLGMATPRTLAAWSSLGAEPAMEKLRSGVPPTTGELADCVAASEKAIAWTPSAVRFANLGSCEFALARQAPADSANRNHWLDLAATHTEQSLHRDPTDGFTWLRLASIREMRGAAARDIIGLLIKSIEMTPNARPLWRSRSEMLLLYARLMTPDDAGTVRRHLHTIWTFSPPHRPILLEIAHRTNRMDFLLAALADDPEAIDELGMMERQTRFP